MKRELVFAGDKGKRFSQVAKHLLKYFEMGNVEDLIISEFEKVILVKKGGEKEFLEDKYLNKEYLSIVMYSVCGLNNQSFRSSNLHNQVSCMLPVNAFRFTGAMDSTIKSGVEISIRLNDNEIDYVYGDFGLSLAEYVYLLKYVGENQSSVFIIGGTGSGKTTFTNLLIDSISDNEIIKVVGDIHDFCFRKEQKTSEFFVRNDDYKQKFDLLMRTNPDRILIPELTVDNVSLILRAMNSGHNGFMLTLHSNSSELGVAEAFKQNMELSGKSNININDIDKAIKNNIDFLIYMGKTKEGKRGITKVEINSKNILKEAKEGGLFGFKQENKKIAKIIQNKPVADNKQLEAVKKLEVKEENIEPAINKYIEAIKIVETLLVSYNKGLSIRQIEKKFYVPKHHLEKLFRKRK